MDDAQTTESAEPQQLETIETDRQFRVIRFSPDGSQLFGAAYDATIHRWDLAGEQPAALEPLEGLRGWAESLLFSPSHNMLLSTDSWGQLCAWNLAEEPPKTKWNQENAHNGWVRAVALQKDESLIATAGRDQFVRVWDAATGERRHELKGHESEVFAVAIHPDGKSVASCDLFGHLKHWDLEDEKCVRELHLEKMHYYERDQDVAGVYSLRFSDDGETLLVAGSEPSNTGNVAGTPTIHWLKWESLEIAKTLTFGESKQGYVYDYAFHPGGYVVAVTSGAPGAGQFLCQRLDEEQPFFNSNKMSNCHSLAFDTRTNRCIVASTNRNSQGNGAVRDKEGNYVGNTSPLTVFALPDA